MRHPSHAQASKTGTPDVPLEQAKQSEAWTKVAGRRSHSSSDPKDASRSDRKTSSGEASSTSSGTQTQKLAPHTWFKLVTTETRPAAPESKILSAVDAPWTTLRPDQAANSVFQRPAGLVSSRLESSTHSAPVILTLVLLILVLVLVLTILIYRSLFLRS